MKSNASSPRLRKRMKDLQAISTRIEAKMAKLEKIIVNISKNA